MGKPSKLIGVHAQGKGTFRINFRDNDGKRHFETVEVDTAEEAAGVRHARLGDISKGLPVSSKPNTVTFEELAADVVNDYIVNRYDSKPDIEARYRLHLLPFFGTRKASKITTADFRAYIVKRMDEGAKPATINRELEAARHAYLLAMKCTPKKVLDRPHIPMLEERNVRKGFFERPQFDALCRHLPKHLVPVATFGYITGWRHEEVVTLRWRHVHFDAGEIRLEPGETKNEEGRTFPMAKSNKVGDELRNLLEGIRPRHTFPESLVFNTDKPRLIDRKDPSKGTTTAIDRFDKAWATACQKAGLPMKFVEKQKRVDPQDASKGKEVVRYKRGPKRGQPMMVRRAAVYFHDFRRTAYRNLVRSGVPEKIARAAVGWIDPMTAERYNIVSAADLDVLREKRIGSAATQAAAAGATFGANSTKNETENIENK